jgi:chromosome segregation ATPase
MRVDIDDKEQLAPDIKRDAEPDKVEALAAERHEEASAEAVVDVQDHLDDAAAHYGLIAGLLEQILAGEDIDEEHIAGLTEDERDALDALESSVIGRDRKAQQIIYAEDRLDLLNRALAVLQPTLAVALVPELEAMRDKFDDLVVQVSELRDHLESLDSAQEEMFEQDRGKPEEVGAPTDTDDKPDEEDPDRMPGDGKPRRSTLVGEPAVEKRPTPTTLTGKPGEPAVEKPVVPSTVYDGKVS